MSWAEIGRKLNIHRRTVQKVVPPFEEPDVSPGKESPQKWAMHAQQRLHASKEVQRAAGQQTSSSLVGPGAPLMDI